MADLNNVNTDSNVNELWEQYKVKHNKTYADQEDENRRFQIFTETIKTIIEHNGKHDEGKETFRMGINHFADLLPEERARYAGAHRKPE